MKNIYTTPENDQNVGAKAANVEFIQEKNILNILQQAVVWILVLLWFYTALDKLIFYSAYTLTMQGQIFPRVWLPLLIPAVPLVELLTGTMLMVSTLRLCGMICSLLLMISFTVYAGLIFFGFFPAKPCACAGLFRDLTWGIHFLVNLFFMLVAAFGIIVNRIERKEGKE